MGIAFGVLALVAVAANMIVRVKGPSWRAFTFKTVCGVLFCVLGVAGLRHVIVHMPGTHLVMLAVFILIGLVLGLLGDACLALKDLVDQKYDLFFLAGFLCFALGHVAFIIGLLRGWDTPVPWPPILICAALASAYVVAGPRIRLEFGSFKWIVAVYSLVVLMLPAMGFFTVVTASGDLAQPWIMAIAGVCFLISDLVLAWTYFGPGKDEGWEHVVCYVFYYAAQFGIASSLFWI